MTETLLRNRPTVAVLGASRNRNKFGNQSVRAHLRHGYDVFPINPFSSQIEGLRSYRSLDDLPVETLDRVTVYLPPEIGLSLLNQIAAKRPREVWFNPGSESEELLASARAIGLRVIEACSMLNLNSRASAAESGV
jgi:predicted CoA-binding protein